MTNETPDVGIGSHRLEHHIIFRIRAAMHTIADIAGARGAYDPIIIILDAWADGLPAFHSDIIDGLNDLISRVSREQAYRLTLHFGTIMTTSSIVVPIDMVGRFISDLLDDPSGGLRLLASRMAVRCAAHRIHLPDDVTDRVDPIMETANE